MKNLVRGGAILLLVGLFVMIILARTTTDSSLAIANDSHENSIENKLVADNSAANDPTDNTSDNLNNSILVDPPDDELIQQDDDKKLVKTTSSVKIVGAGASKGAFSATAYCFTGRTSSGQKVRRGLIAADPRVLKMGSRVFISAGQWSGTYLVSDKGGAIKGKRIDIWVPGCSEARKFGRRTVQIFATQ